MLFGKPSRTRCSFKRRGERRICVTYQRGTPIQRLPYEILLMILERMEDFVDLAAAVEAFKPFYKIYEKYCAVIIRSISTNICAKVCGYNVWNLYQQLAFAIHRCFIPTVYAKEAFIMSWPIFSTRQLEETLYPLARALAWSYCIDGNEEAAVKSLRAIWNQSQPFTGWTFKMTRWSPRPPLRSPSYAFVGSLLQDLMGEPENTSIREQLEEMQSRQEVQPWVGVQFNKEGALVVRDRVGSIRVYYPPRILLSQSGVKLLKAMPGGKARAKEPRRRHKQQGGTRATFVYRLRSLQP